MCCSQGKVVCTLFMEPSTRTCLSFQTATVRLGASYINFLPELSSMKKHETDEDTMRILSGFADAIVIRHPKLGSVKAR